jgi:hypothetical protein
MPTTDPILCADVILIPQSGKSIEHATITAESLQEFAPPQEALGEAQDYFAKAGFTIGALSGIGFSICAPKGVFERVFGATIEFDASGSVAVKGRKGRVGLELPLGGLPVALGRTIHAITFAHAPEFGPTGGFK